MNKLYHYKSCSTCKKAIKYLDGKNIDYKAIDISENPPTKKELKQMLVHLEGDIKKLFNTSGKVYRDRNLKEQVASMSATEAIDILALEGMLIKRPFYISPDSGVVGFKVDQWDEIF